MRSLLVGALTRRNLVDDSYHPVSGTIPVQIGLVVDEITAINQQSENFLVVF